MDFATISGLIIALTALITSFNLEGGEIDNIFLVAPMCLVIGGSFGVAIIGSPSGTMRRIPRYIWLAIFGQRYNHREIIEKMVVLADRARREGILALERESESLKNPFFRKGIQLVIDGTEVETICSILDSEINNLESRHQRGIDFFVRLGGYSPTLGILGTVLALVHTLGRVDEPEKMAAAIASAFIATLWGVGMANMVYLPLADKLKQIHDDEAATLELITEGVVAIQMGENPRLIKTRMLSIYSMKDRIPLLA